MLSKEMDWAVLAPMVAPMETVEVRVMVAMAVKDARAASQEVEPMEAPTPREVQEAATRPAVVTTVRARPEMVAVAATVQENKEFALMMPVAAEVWVAAAACTVAAAWDLIAVPRGVADVERMGSAGAVMVPAVAVVGSVVAARGLEAAALVAKAATEAGLDSADGPGAMAEVERAAAARALVARALAVAAMPEVVAKVGASQVKEEVVVMARARAAAAGKGSVATERGVVAVARGLVEAAKDTAAAGLVAVVTGSVAVEKGREAAATGLETAAREVAARFVAVATAAKADSSRSLARSTVRPGSRPRSHISGSPASKPHHSCRQGPNPTSRRQFDTGMGMPAAATAAAAAATCNLGTPCRTPTILRSTTVTSAAAAAPWEARGR